MNDIKKILVVDDEEGIRDIFGAYLAKKGHKVELASDGLEAIRKTDSEKFDYIFLDIKMSGLNGIETFKRIKAKDPDCRIIIMTGYKTMAEELIPDSLKNNIYSILYKPFSMKEVTELIK